jgi:hypothetical protein
MPFVMVDALCSSCWIIKETVIGGDELSVLEKVLIVSKMGIGVENKN